MLRRLTGAFALLALLATPVVAESRMVCRYTGVAIDGCAEDSQPSLPVLQDAGCCERRTATTTGPVAALERPRPVGTILLAVLPAPRSAPGRRAAPPAPSFPTGAVGPPLFLRTRALLL